MPMHCSSAGHRVQHRSATAAPVLSRDECEDIVRNMRRPARGASHPRNSRPTLLPTETFYPGKLWLCSCDWAHHEEFLERCQVTMIWEALDPYCKHRKLVTTRRNSLLLRNQHLTWVQWLHTYPVPSWNTSTARRLSASCSVKMESSSCTASKVTSAQQGA